MGIEAPQASGRPTGASPQIIGTTARFIGEAVYQHQGTAALHDPLDTVPTGDDPIIRTVDIDVDKAPPIRQRSVDFSALS